MANKNSSACSVCRMVVILGTVMMMMMMMLRISAADPDSLQDLCVADKSSTALKVNGYPCKSKSPTANDFFYRGLASPNKPGPNATVITPASVDQIPGLNTLGVSMARADYAPNSVNPPHTHPRATEIVFVLEGQLDVGFLTTADVLITKTLERGDVFVFPKGLLHYQRNIAKNNPASAIVAFDSQLPGRQSIPDSLFASKPSVPDEVLARAFMIDTAMVKTIKGNLTKKKK